MPLRVPLSPLPPESAPVLTPTDPYAHFPPFRLQNPISLVGNRKGVHVRLRSRQISGIHAVIVCGKNRTWIRDLGSRTGTHLNGEPVTEAELVPGDSLRLGPLTCSFARSVRPKSPGAAPVSTLTLLTNEAGKRIEWDGRVFLIGRRERADLIVPGETVSEVHALLCQIDGRFYVRDAGSRTGTFLNNVSVPQAEICVADVIRVGSTTLKCLGKSGPPTRADAAELIRPTQPDADPSPDEDLPEPPPEWGPLAAAVGRPKALTSAADGDPAAAPTKKRLSQLWKRLRR